MSEYNAEQQPSLEPDMSRKLARAADQRYWSYIENLDETVEPDSPAGIVEQATGLPFDQWQFQTNQDVALHTIERDSRVLNIPEVRRFAEYFGAIPIKDGEKTIYRTFEDRYSFEKE